MAHKIKKVLLVDDTYFHPHGSGREFYANLNSNLRRLVDFQNHLSDKIEVIDDYEVKTTFNKEYYELFILHASYQSSMLNLSQLSSLKFLTKNLVTFSGGANTSIELSITSREQLFRSLKRALEAYFVMGQFPRRFLFEYNINRYYPLLDKMQDILEKEGKEGLIHSESLLVYLRILGRDVKAVKQNFQENKSEDELNEKINEWRINFSI